MKRPAKLLPPVTPGEILKEEFMAPYGLSVNALAKYLSVPPGRISEILRGRRAITADTALRLGKFFGMTAQFWLNLQAGYELQLAQREWPKLEHEVTRLPSALRKRAQAS